MHPSAGGDMRTQCRGQSALEGSLRRNVLSTDDVVAMVDYLVERNPELLSSRDQDGALPRVADFSTVQYLVNLYKAYVKSVTSKETCRSFWPMWDHVLSGRGTQREEEQRKEEETLRNYQRQAKGTSEGKYNNTARGSTTIP
jgi:hypothetical protein